MDLKGTFHYGKNQFSEELMYTCVIEQQQIAVDEILNISGMHLDGKTNVDVKYVKFLECPITRVPQRLTDIFPSLTGLIISHSSLKTVTKDVFDEYSIVLECFYLQYNQIEFVPGDLFEGFENLKAISFYGNKLKIIEPTIFDGLNNLIFVDLRHNPNYNTYYLGKSGYADIKRVKDELKQVFCENIQLYKDLKDAEAQQVLLSDIKNIIQHDSFKDFKILIGDRQFAVHKFFLAARSPTLAEILNNNPEVENLSLCDISVDTFEIILNYIYTAAFPERNEYNQLSLYAAAGRLKIEKLMNYVAAHILDQITDENALDVLKVSNKYEHYGLKQKSFDIIKKKYVKIIFKDEWIEEPETVRIIIDKFEKKRKLSENWKQNSKMNVQICRSGIKFNFFASFLSAVSSIAVPFCL